MESKYFSLGQDENSKLVKVIRILFGLVCISISIFWIIFNIRSVKTDRTLWVTVLFLFGFGLYQVGSGLGHTIRFIEIGNDKIILKKNSLLPIKEIRAAEIKKIEVFSLSLRFYLHTGEKTVLRFGTTYTDNIDPIKSEIEQFATCNNIYIETITEEI
jgi:hypothetical protein